MQANMPRSFQAEDFVVISESAEGSRQQISGSLYFTRHDRDGTLGPVRAMMKIEQPQALRDSAYLILQSTDYVASGMFVYLPAIGRVRRVSGEMADGRLFGTDITYYDFKQFRSAMADLKPSYVSYRSDAEYPAHELRFTPPASINAGYDEVIALIDAETCLPTEMNFFDRGHKVKVLSVPREAMKRDGERWYMQEFSLRDSQRGSHTRFLTGRFESDPNLSEKLFHPASFYR